MTIAAQRLARHHLVGPPLPSAEAVVGHTVAVQAQDVVGAKWGVAQRRPRPPRTTSPPGPG